jgi:lipopolysaccharide exporter
MTDPNSNPPPAKDPKQALIAGAAWTIGMRWSAKGLGFVNTAIMARLLMPADYGVVAMAMLVVGLIQAFLDLGVDTALLRKNEVSRDEVDSAWTLHIIQSLIVGAFIGMAGWPAELYFKEARVGPMLWVLAACVVVAGFQNVGMVLAQKALNFKLEFTQMVLAKSLSVAATITAGVLLGDYRALLIGIATGYIGNTALSYWLHPYRPRWNTSRIGDIWAVTKWLMIGNMGGYLLGKVDELIAARVGSTAQFGIYNVGADLGTIPVASIGPAIMQSLLPVLARFEHEPERTNRAITKTIGALNTVTLPIGLGFAAMALPITLLALGAKWADTALFVALFSLCGAARFLLNPLHALLVLKGHAKITSRVVWAEFGFFVVFASVLVPTLALPGLALARLSGILCNAGMTAWSARRHCQIDLRAVGAGLIRPMLGSVLMAGLMWLTAQQFTLPILQLACGMLVGGAFFITWSFVTWHFAKRPDGLESTVIEQYLRWKTR